MVCNLEQGTVTVLVMQHHEKAHFRETCKMKNKNAHGSKVYCACRTYANIQEIMDESMRDYHNIKAKNQFKLLVDYSI